MPANLEARGGVWYFRAMILGKLYRKSTGFRVGTRSNQTSAKRRASEIENEIRSGNLGWVKPDAPLFQVWAEHYLTAYHPNRYTERVLMRRPLKRWADRPIDTIMQSEIRAFLNDWQTDGAKAGTLERARVLLSGLFRAALQDKKIADNPMTHIGVIRTTPKARVLTKEAETALRAILPPQWDRFLTVALTTGARRGELLGFRPMDLRENGTMIWVRPETNKTKKGRLIPLRAETVEALKLQAASRPGGDSTPYWQCASHTPTVLMKRWCEKLKLPVVSPHDCRRTFGTRCAQAGMYPKHLQQILGHASIEMTMKFYVHLEQQSLIGAMNGVTL